MLISKNENKYFPFTQIASAAPPSTQFTFFDYLFSGLVSGIENTLNKNWANIECVVSVIDEVIGESDIKDVWDETDRTLGNLINVEWPKCLEIENAAEQRG